MDVGSGPSERVPQFDAYAAGGDGWRRWRLRCRTCGWEVSGTGQTSPEAFAAKSAHRCERRPVEPS